MERDQILQALSAFIARRPGLQPGNYISSWNDTAGRKAYRAESRQITRDRHDAEHLLREVSLSGMPLETLREAFRAYSGRLKLFENAQGGVALDYHAGQYFPTEYRRAVCAVLAQALWDYHREDYAASARRCAKHRIRDGELHVGGVIYKDCDACESAGDAIRRNFRRRFGARFARRWFDA